MERTINIDDKNDLIIAKNKIKIILFFYFIYKKL